MSRLIYGIAAGSIFGASFLALMLHISVIAGAPRRFFPQWIEYRFERRVDRPLT